MIFRRTATSTYYLATCGRATCSAWESDSTLSVASYVAYVTCCFTSAGPMTAEATSNEVIVVSAPTAITPCRDESGVRFCVLADEVVESRSLAFPGTVGYPHRVAGHVDAYRFVLPNGTVVVVPCVTLTAAGGGVDACAAAGGTFSGRVLTLVDETASVPPATTSGAVTVGVCAARLTATVTGFGVESTDIYTLC